MSKILVAPGDDPSILKMVKDVADPSLTEEEVITDDPPRDRKVAKVAPGVFLYDSGGGMSSKWLHYRKIEVVKMIGLLAGVDFSPSPSEFQSLLDSGDLVAGLQYVTIELTKKEAQDSAYVTTMFQGAAVQQGWMQGAQSTPKIQRAEVNGKPVVIAYPSSAAAKKKGATEAPSEKKWWQIWK